MEHLSDSIPEPETSTQQQIAAAFLHNVFGKDAPGWLTLWLWPSKYTHWLRATHLDQAAAYAVKQAQTCDVYVGVGLRGARLPRGRGEAKDVTALPAFYVDIDLKHPVHKAHNLPETIEQAWQLLTSIDLPPSLLVHSGHGLQAWWLLRELWALETAEEHARAAQLTARLQATIRAAAQLRGWHLDGTADLARVLRVPGTCNRKVADHIVPVTLEESHPERRYNPSDFEPYLIDLAHDARTYQVQGPSTAWPDELPHVDVHQLNVTATIKFLIVTGTHPNGPRHPSRSEAEWRVINELIDAGYDDAVIASVLLDPANRIGEKAREQGCTWVAQEIGRARAKARQAPPGDRHASYRQGLPNPPPPEEPPRPPPLKDPPPSTLASDNIHLTDMGNAQRLIQHYGHELHYVDLWGKWLQWDGRQWQLDHTRSTEAKAKRVVTDLFRWASRKINEMSAQLETAEEGQGLKLKEQLVQLTAVLKWALTSEAAPRIKAMVELAKSDMSVAMTPDHLDRDVWLLNCHNGTLDLRTGELRPHQRQDLLTKRCPIIYDKHAVCPLWRQFLQDIMAGNQALISYLQRALGYSLTGSVEEQCLFFLYGPGQNGKSTFLSVILAMLTDYAMQTIPELLMVRSHEQHPTERADLFGKRFVATIEVEAGKRMAESLVKQLTGGDRIRARRMREDFWEFDPTHKIWLAANHKPIIRGRDYAIWRRIRLIPFTVKIDDQQKDPKLLEKLAAELPGILAWAVQGCQDWQQRGLAEPKEVTDATHAYQAEMDVVGEFLTDCCFRKPGSQDIKTNSTVLHQAFLKWSGETTMTQKAFADALQELGYMKKMGGDGRMYWLGIGLVVTHEENGTR